MRRGRGGRAERVEAIVSTRGLLFRAKLQRPFAGMHVSVDVHEPRARLTPREWDGETGVLEGPDVRLETATGDVVSLRRDARRSFRGLRRAIRWDRLDLTYFGGYAFWNYLAFSHGRWNGLPFPSHRRVTPRGPAARPLRGPTLVEIVVHEWRLVERERRG